MSTPSSVVGIFPGDLIIKTTLELMLDDLRKNPWVIEDIFRVLMENPLLSKKYGLQEIQRAKEFVLNNDIPVYMALRVDKQQFPCITVTVGSSDEAKDLATLADGSPYYEDMTGEEINQSIQYIIPPFNIESYDKDTGIVEVPTTVENYKYIDAGMIAVNPETGGGFVIIEKAGTNGFRITAGSELSTKKIGIVPQYQLFRAKRERAFSQEVYNIGLHIKGDIGELLFLYAIVKYGLYRYREGLLEYQNFNISSIQATELIKNDAFGEENIYSRFIKLTGLVEESWLKTPYRFIEAIDLVVAETINNVEVLEHGIKILSEDPPEELDTDDDPWITVEE